MQKIAIITSGGDAPGMNACIRAIVRTATAKKLEVIGFKKGFDGIMDDKSVNLDNAAVGNIIQRGGTILKTARSQRFFDKEHRKQAYEVLKKNNVDALVVIGGDGSFTGASIFSDEYDLPIIGLPGTIDNDLYGTDFTIGYDTAINTVVSAVDKIRDTALSHDRVFVIEVMGKDAGLIALRSGLGVGAEAILIPETETYIEHLYERLASRRDNKQSAIVIVAEGDDFGNGEAVAKAIKSKYENLDVKLTVLGHVQRGGNPSALDRVFAAQMGCGAVEALLEGKSNIMVGIESLKTCEVPLSKAIKHHKQINEDLLNLAEMLSA